MKTVWVIEQGEYSGYRVTGVFTSEENAQFIADRINAIEQGRYGEATVDEWPLNPGIDEINKGLSKWRIGMLKNGNVYYAEPDDARLVDINESYFYLQEAYGERPEMIVSKVWARDEQHAVKIVNERRTQMIANGEWK
jgi:hypothetical protein